MNKRVFIKTFKIHFYKHYAMNKISWYIFASALSIVFGHKCIVEAKQKYRGVFETQKSENKTSTGDIGLDIRTHASPEMGQDQVFQ